MRRGIVFGTLIAVGALGWVLLDADPDGRQELVDRITNAFTDEREPPLPPNWGDVATKVGEFAEEERTLREALNPSIGAEPTPPGAGNAAEP